VDHYEDAKKSLATEDCHIEYNAYLGRSIAVFTSGGDSQVIKGVYTICKCELV
jgi:hypothetical protein